MDLEGMKEDVGFSYSPLPILKKAPVHCYSLPSIMNILKKGLLDVYLPY